MIEKLLKRTRENVARHGAKPFRWLRFFSPGVWIILGVVAMTGGRWLWLQEHRPAHLENLAAAYGGVRLFQGTPQINHIGSQVTYVATADRGFALFLCDTATGQRHVIFSTEKLGAWGDVNNLQAGPWSPDDSAFIYYASNQLFVCPASGKQPAEPVRNRVGVSDVMWLSPADLVYLVDKTRIGLAQKQTNGLWKLSEVLRWPSPILSLNLVENRTLAWLADGQIYRGILTEEAKLLPIQGDVADMTEPLPKTMSNSMTASLPTNGMVLHLDASTLQQSNQTPVTLLGDLSPRHNDAVANGQSPVYNAPGSPRALNGLGTIQFASNKATNGTGLKTLHNLGLTNALPRTVFAILRRDLGPGKRMMVISLGQAGVRGAYFGINDATNAIYLPSGWDSLDNKVPVLSGHWNLLEVIYDGVSQKGYVNGTLKGVTTHKLATADNPVEIGRRTGKATGGSDGDFAELLIYDRALSTSERRQVESYLRVKWFGASLSAGDDRYVWLAPELDGINSLSYSREAGKLLVQCSEAGLDSIWALNPQEGRNANPVRLVQGKLTGDVQWMDWDEFCYRSYATGHSGLILSDLNGIEKSRLFSRGDIKQFQIVPHQRQLFFLGIATNEPAAGLWQYDLASSQLQSVVPYADDARISAQDTAPMHWPVILPGGRTVNCTLYPPAKFDRHKKYPLVLGNTMFGVAVKGAHGRLWVPGVAASGAFVVIIDRAGWFEGIGQWEENVRGVYEQLKRDPCIDTGQVFLFGASAETQYMGTCLEKTPGLWKGAIFLNPTGLPDFTKSPPLASRPKILISVGGEEHQEERLKKYQVEALNSGALVEYVVHPGEMHHLVGNAAQLERTKALMHFIFEE
jgi:hypothetical protein